MDDINTPLANDSHLQLGLVTSLNTPNIILAEVYHRPHVYKSRRQGGQLRCLVEWRVLWSCPSSCFHELNGTFPLPQLVYLSQEGTFEEVHLWRTEAKGAGPCLEDRWVGLPEPLSEESQVMGVGQPVIPSEGGKAAWASSRPRLCRMWWGLSSCSQGSWEGAGERR